jgi:hypothetical protein
MIGHTGICTADGKVHDFAGSFYISVFFLNYISNLDR